MCSSLPSMKFTLYQNYPYTISKHSVEQQKQSENSRQILLLLCANMATVKSLQFQTLSLERRGINPIPEEINRSHPRFRYHNLKKKELNSEKKKSAKMKLEIRWQISIA